LQQLHNTEISSSFFLHKRVNVNINYYLPVTDFDGGRYWQRSSMLYQLKSFNLMSSPNLIAVMTKSWSPVKNIYCKSSNAKNIELSAVHQESTESNISLDDILTAGSQDPCQSPAWESCLSVILWNLFYSFNI